jgi:hypothetical protein
MSATEARVLIIEDNDALRAMLFTVLRHQIDILAHAVRECALVVPLPDEPLDCSPAESDFRSRFDDSGAFFN